MKVATQIEDANGNIITVTFRANGDPASAIKITGSINLDLAQIKREFPAPPDEFWAASDDCHAYVYTGATQAA